MTHNRERIKNFVHEQSQKSFPPTKNDISKTLEVSEKTVYNQTKKLRRKHEIQILSFGSEKRYAPYGWKPKDLEGASPIRREIKWAIQWFRNTVEREPRMRDVAAKTGRNLDNETFRAIFFDVAQEKNWMEPSPQLVKEKNQGLREKLRKAYVWKHDLNVDSSYPETLEERIEIQDFLSDNEELVDGCELKEERAFGGVVEPPSEVRGLLPQPEFAVCLESV